MEMFCRLCGRRIYPGEEYVEVETPYGKEYVHRRCYERVLRGTVYSTDPEWLVEAIRSKPAAAGKKDGETADPPSLLHPLRAVIRGDVAGARRLAWEVYKALRRGDYDTALQYAEALRTYLEQHRMLKRLAGLVDRLVRAVRERRRCAAYSLLVRLLYSLSRIEELYPEAEPP